MTGILSSRELVYDLDEVLPFVQHHVQGLGKSEGMRAIGLRRSGELVAGVLYEGFNGQNLWMHVAGTPGAKWLDRTFLAACFSYPFNICGVKRVSGYVNASNSAARRFNEHLGFKEEARLSEAAPDGGDVIIYVMRREDCRYA